MSYLPSCVWFIPHSIIFSVSTHAAVNDTVFYFLKVLIHFIVYTDIVKDVQSQHKTKICDHVSVAKDEDWQLSDTLLVT